MYQKLYHFMITLPKTASNHHMAHKSFSVREQEVQQDTFPSLILNSNHNLMKSIATWKNQHRIVREAKKTATMPPRHCYQDGYKRKLMTELRRKKAAYGGWKQGEGTREEYRNIAQAGRDGMRKAKTQLELRLAKQNVGLLLNMAGDSVTADTDQAEMLHAFCASDFTKQVKVCNNREKENVAPVIKKGKRMMLFSFTSKSNKIMAQILLEHIPQQLRKKKGKKYDTHLVAFCDKMTGFVDKWRRGDIIYVDFSKASSTLPQCPVAKLDAGLGGAGGKSLAGRSGSEVVVTGPCLPGDWCPVGSHKVCLGPVLFNISVRDLGRCAGDAKLGAPVDMHKGRVAVQRDLDRWEERTRPPCAWGRSKGQPCPRQAEPQQ
ncbi:hypothetical protein QYF61_014336 [Mycteria americana]|uniref:Uncharacterized protein n=1 Tax=Mycteria americana TaxID=33587 RepID=A0AAN7N209_MYCAM|nr:hypothetical protein QYF61_014336 [Mycteria americana]